MSTVIQPFLLLAYVPPGTGGPPSPWMPTVGFVLGSLVLVLLCLVVGFFAEEDGSGRQARIARRLLYAPLAVVYAGACVLLLAVSGWAFFTLIGRSPLHAGLFAAFLVGLVTWTARWTVRPT